MGIYLKKFNINYEYEQYINSNDIILPNVSLIAETNGVYYNNNADFIIKYVVDTDDQVQLYFYNDEITNSNPFLSHGVDAFNNIEIDGVNVSIADLDENKGKYAFTSGEHTVKYILKKQLIGIIGSRNNFEDIGALFATCNNIKDVIINISNDIVFGASVFSGCTNLTSVTISDNVTNIGNGAFANCSSLTSINIPDSVTTINAGTFTSCSGLTSIVIPDSVTNIGGGAFYRCSNLVSVTVNSITPPTLYAGSAPGEPIYPGSFDSCSSDLKIYVPAESVEIYKAAEGWSNYADIILSIE